MNAKESFGGQKETGEGGRPLLKKKMEEIQVKQQQKKGREG